VNRKRLIDELEALYRASEGFELVAEPVRCVGTAHAGSFAVGFDRQGRQSRARPAMNRLRPIGGGTARSTPV
jgi:hypothetical protein